MKKEMKEWLGTVLSDNFRIEGYLGEGGQSDVFHGTDIMTGMPVAIKRFKRFSKGGENNYERFVQEARTQLKLVHQNIVGIRTILKQDNPEDRGDEEDYFIVMEFVSGGSLMDYIETVDPQTPNWEEVGKIFFQILEGLGFAHRKGVLHRDMKPSNVLLTDELQVKVADFGLAKVLESKQLTQAGLVLGTPAYIAPEQIDGSGHLDQRCDIYSIGVMLYETLSGHTPYQKPGETLAPFELMGRHLFMEPPSLKEIGVPVSAAFEDVVMKGLAKKAEDRFPDCRAFQDALVEVLQHELGQNLYETESRN
ncbi:MAG: serine/threonine-protein kinase, partial [Myxococcota bacterium]